MILKEDFIILDEEDSIDLLDEANDESGVAGWGIVKSGSDIDTKTAAGQKAVTKAKEKYDKILMKPNMREYKSSDKPILAKSLKNKEFIKALFGSNVSRYQYKVINYNGMNLMSAWFDVSDLTGDGGKTVGRTSGYASNNRVYLIAVNEKKNKIVLKSTAIRGKVNEVANRIS